MQIASLILGIFSIAGLIFGFFPCLGWFNWFNIPLSITGLIISIVALTKTTEESKVMSVVGLCCCGIAIVFGIIRLILGAGVV